MNEVFIVIGAYGSGKSEYSIHLSRQLKLKSLNVALADLDIVNPYFRIREVVEQFVLEGIDVIAPEGQFRFADVPMISPRIAGSIQNRNLSVVLDVGGDPAGCRALARFTGQLENRGYRLIHVINTNRPFTSTSQDIIRMHETLEYASKLKITEMVCNTNLMEYTDAETVRTGINIIQEVAASQNIVFDKYLVLDKYAKLIPDDIMGKTREVMSYTLNKPWEIIAEGI